MSKKPDLSQYNKLKEYKGQKYMGVRVGRGHTWHYDAGLWKETKVTPDKWEFTYNVGKTRAGHAPEGSGAPVGTEYHWYIIANQVVKKLDANSYSTEMSGSKYKIAHKRANKEQWNAAESKQRKEMIKILKDVIAELETAPEPEAPEHVAGEDKKPRLARQTKLIQATPEQ